MSNGLPNQLLGMPRPSASGLETACTGRKGCPDAPDRHVQTPYAPDTCTRGPLAEHTQRRAHASACVTCVRRRVVGVAQAAFPTFAHNSLHMLTWR